MRVRGGCVPYETGRRTEAGRQAGRDVWMVVARAMVRDIPQIPEEQAFQDILFCFITG